VEATTSTKSYQEKIASLEQQLAEAERRASEAEAALQKANAGAEVVERKRAEEALRKLSRAVEQSPVSVVITDTEGTIEYVNPKFTQLTGYTLEEARVQNPRILKSGRTSESVYRDLWTTIRAGETWQGEFWNKKKNGDLYVEAVSISPITNEEGVITHFVAVKEDITARKQAEETLRDYAEKLEHSNRELLEFAFVASHDLHEPLRKIEAFGSALLGMKENLNPTQRNYLDRMQQSAQRMRRMIDDLLTLSRVTTQGKPFELVDLSQIAAEVLADLEIQIQSTGGRVEVDRLPELYADPFQMRRLFQNLIGNALKYHKPDSPPVVWICAEPLGTAYVQIMVRDNGIGFEEKQVERIFQPFQRLVAKSAYEGTGMGLAICRKIVERHGGSITAQSSVGQGSTFIVTLPLRSSA
jgi:PAS domain S-box-containing protein